MGLRRLNNNPPASLLQAPLRHRSSLVPKWQSLPRQLQQRSHARQRSVLVEKWVGLLGDLLEQLGIRQWEVDLEGWELLSGRGSLGEARRTGRVLLCQR